MESFEISDLEPIDIKIDADPLPSSSGTNFGGGIELLMNDKNKSNTNVTNVDIADLDKLEDDLNNLSSVQLNADNFQPTTDDPPLKVKFDTDSKIGASTAESAGSTNTWDGFMKFSEMPGTGVPSKTAPVPNVNLTEREKRRKKRVMLKSLSDWQEKGYIKDGSRFTIDSNYDEIEDEYESALEDKRKRDSVKIQQNWMITMINTIEYGNAMFDPFGLNLDGWGEAVSEDIDSYDEIFGELYEKYKGGKMSPELSLLMRLGFSASVIHFSNKALSTATPGFNDVIKQSPELMRMFTNATVDSMKQSSPGMAFAEELLNSKPNTSSGPPPAPVDTRGEVPPQRPGSMQYTTVPSSRPDIQAGRGMEAMNTMFKESGVELNGGASDIQEKTTRPEMTGPRNADIDSILSGLKTKPEENESVPVKNIDIHPSIDEDSIISVSSLRDIDSNAMPKKSRRKRNTSDKKVVSLDI